MSKIRNLIPCDDLILQLRSHVVEIVGITSHTHQQVTVVFGMALRIEQGGGIDNIKLDMMATHLEIGTDQTGQLALVGLSPKQTGCKAHVEQCATALGLVELA